MSVFGLLLFVGCSHSPYEAVSFEDIVGVPFVYGGLGMYFTEDAIEKVDAESTIYDCWPSLTAIAKIHSDSMMNITFVCDVVLECSPQQVTDGSCWSEQSSEVYKSVPVACADIEIDVQSAEITDYERNVDVLWPADGFQITPTNACLSSLALDANLEDWPTVGISLVDYMDILLDPDCGSNYRRWIWGVNTDNNSYLLSFGDLEPESGGYGELLGSQPESITDCVSL